ncbi:hypothetical protein [Agrobacterium genomosp. 2]|uniref:Uncharacterized protein n=1 Tax=Agrobacterium genomosp. 2 str. CFBP 5494 TaxID=1183436 RepID=A0A9W5AYJ8_9HYPH|nr:hypothetical protein [Agrobacterium genomosp. 2]CUW87443.1 hypothetical protein AGR2A_Cc120048 [Agrobacterium genomosp. 2 str. CFBP 5494]
MGATYIPTAWKSATAQQIEDALSSAVIRHIDLRGLTASDISRRYPSIRLEHLQKLRRGEALGFRMLSSLAEAVGLRVKIEVTP